MADISKTVAIIFSAESDGASSKINDLGKSLDNLDTSAKTPNVAAASKSIDAVGESAKVTDTQARALGEGLKKLAEDAGAPKETLEGIDAVLARIGGSVTGSAVVAAAAIAAFSVVALKAGVDAFEFKTKVDNLNGSTEKSQAAFNFVRVAVGELEINLTDALDSYSKFLVELNNTGISAKTAEDAFIGITAAFKGQGDGLKESQKSLKDFVDVAKDGTIDLKELEEKIADIPGGLRIFSEVLGVTQDDLKVLAENGALGSKEIDILAKALRDQNYGSITPVKDAFVDLYNTLKQIGIDMGAEGVITAAFWALDKAIRSLTLSAIGGKEFFVLLGTTLANMAYSIKESDWEGFKARQDDALGSFSKNVESARNKLLGLGEEAEKPLPAEGYKELAESIKAGGIAAEATAKAIKDGALQTKALEKASKDADASLKALGLDPKKFEEPIANIVKAFTDLASNPIFNDGKGGSQILSGLLVTLDKIQNGPAGAESLKAVGDAIEATYKKGALSASEYAAATQALQVKQSGLWDGMIKTTGSIQEQKKALDDAAKASQKAKDQAAQYYLELEKLASNERIKLIESKVKLDVAEFEYKAKIVEAAFTSINTTIDATSKNIGDLWKLMDNPSMTFSDKWALEDQIEKENALREKSFELQKKLLEATIQEIELRAKAFASGDALIKIDGAGLQPHLEAFMWEILRTLQTRVNADGLKLLLGT